MYKGDVNLVLLGAFRSPKIHKLDIKPKDFTNQKCLYDKRVIKYLEGLVKDSTIREIAFLLMRIYTSIVILQTSQIAIKEIKNWLFKSSSG